MSSRKGTRTRRARWIERLGLRTQLVAFFLIVFGGLFAAFSAGMYYYIANVNRHQFDAALNNYSVDVSHEMPEFFPNRTVIWDADDLETELVLPFSRHDVLLQVMDDENRVVLRSKNLGDRRLPKLSAARSPPRTGVEPFYADIHLRRSALAQEPNQRYRIVSHSFEREGRHFHMQAAVPVIEHREGSLLLFLAVAVPLMLLAAGAAGHAFSRRAMAPVAAIIQKANEIEARHLSERIPVPECRDEIRELALTLNGLLDRLELAFRSQEAFVADASHQLKTPLSILKGEVDVFRRGKGTAEEAAELIGSVAQEIHYLERIVEDLLLLAQADSRQIEKFSQVFGLDERVLECVARLQRAPGRTIDISVNLHPEDESSPSFEMVGDPELARALVENLVDNALKYSTKGAPVRVELRAERKFLVLEVRDEGPGIPVDALPHVFDRFYRASATRNVAVGSGLGLSIVRRVAMLHGGEVGVGNATPHGAVFTVRLPRAES